MSKLTALAAVAKLIKDGATKTKIGKKLAAYSDEAVKTVKESKIYRNYMKELTPEQKQTKLPTQAQASVKRNNLQKTGKGAGGGALLTAIFLDKGDKKDKGRGEGNLEIKTRREDKEPTSVAEAKRRGMDYYIGKDGKKKKAVFAEEVKSKSTPTPTPKSQSKATPKSTPTKKKDRVVSETKLFSGGVIRANAGASVLPNRMSRK